MNIKSFYRCFVPVFIVYTSNCPVKILSTFCLQQNMIVTTFIKGTHPAHNTLIKEMLAGASPLLGQERESRGELGWRKGVTIISKTICMPVKALFTRFFDL